MATMIASSAVASRIAVPAGKTIVSQKDSDLRAFLKTRTHLRHQLASKFSSTDFQVSSRGKPVCSALAVASEPIVEEVEKEEVAEEEEEDESLIPDTLEIQSLLLEICDETSIAEVELKVGSFSLHMKRDVGGKAAKSAAAAAAAAAPVLLPPVPGRPMIENLSPVAAAPPARLEDSDDDTDIDEGLAYVTSPKVGIFWRGRPVKGSVGKPLVEEGTEVKKGQVVGFLEQLGTQVAIESEHAGEVDSFLAEDGDPVGFADPLVAIRPSFPGIKKLT